MLRQLQPDDWRTARYVRLQALTCAPNAFGSTLDQANKMTEQDWREWLSMSGEGTTIVSCGRGATFGIIRAGPEGSGAGLFSLWVAADARRQGTGHQLVRSGLDWASTHGYDTVRLDVRRGNLSAIQLYVQLGFELATTERADDPSEDRYLLRLASGFAV